MKFYYSYLILFVFALNYCFGQDMKYIDSLQNAYTKASIDTVKIGLLSELSDAWYESSPDKALEVNNKIVELVEKAMSSYNDQGQKRLFLMKAAAFNNLGILAMDKGDIMLGLDYYSKSIPMFEKAGNKEYLGNAYNNIGFVYENQGDIERGMEYYFKSLKLREEVGDKRGIGESYNNIAYMYNAQNEKEKALETFLKALSFFEEAGDVQGVSLIHTNVGNIYKNKQLYKEALSSFRKSVSIRLGLNDHKGLSNVYINIGDIYENQKQIDSASYYYNAALKEAQLAENKTRIATALQNLASLSLLKGDISKALDYGKESLNLSLELGFPEKIRDSYFILSEVYSAKKDYKLAFESFKSYKLMADSILNDATKQDGIKQQMKYTIDKRELEVIKEKEQSEFKHKEEVKRQNWIIYTSIGVLLIVVVFSIFLNNRFRVTRKQKEIIESQKMIVEQQKHIVEEKHKEITDSINYAERIQRALLASENILQSNFKNYFVLFKPKDVVSGDFYWATTLSNGNFAFVTADSTGHGVPGAIMSILNISCLKEAVKEGLIEPFEILNKTRSLIIDTLAKDGSAEGGKDGMDASLTVYDFKNKKMFFSASHNPVWIARGTEIIELKADKMPVGKHDKQNISFTQQEIQLQSGDVIYSLTDGFPDQFGGEKGKKFMSKNLRELLLANSHLPMNEQKELLEKTFVNWIGNLEQIDDVTIVGVRV